MYHEGQGSLRGAQPEACEASPQQRLRGHILQGIAQASCTQLQPACIDMHKISSVQSSRYSHAVSACLRWELRAAGPN